MKLVLSIFEAFLSFYNDVYDNETYKRGHVAIQVLELSEKFWPTSLEISKFSALVFLLWNRPNLSGWWHFPVLTCGPRLTISSGLQFFSRIIALSIIALGTVTWQITFLTLTTLTFNLSLWYSHLLMLDLDMAYIFVALDFLNCAFRYFFMNRVRFLHFFSSELFALGLVIWGRPLFFLLCSSYIGFISLTNVLTIMTVLIFLFIY